MTSPTTWGAGCEADHLALIAALARFATLDRLANRLGPFAASLADRAYIDLTRVAVLCGYSMRHSNETAFTFAKKRCATFTRMRIS